MMTLAKFLTGKRGFLFLGVVIVLLLALNFTYLGKEEGIAYTLPGFYGLMSFIGVAVAVLAARIFASVTGREEDYYRARSVDSEAWPSGELDMAKDSSDA